jgi:hypothetical protein
MFLDIEFGYHFSQQPLDDPMGTSRAIVGSHVVKRTGPVGNLL